MKMTLYWVIKKCISLSKCPMTLVLKLCTDDPPLILKSILNAAPYTWRNMFCTSCLCLWGPIDHMAGVVPVWFTQWFRMQTYYAWTVLGLYSETGFHIGMDRNFVCLWRRHNCRSQVIDLTLISWFMKSIIGVLNNSNLHAIISTLLLINLHWFKKSYFAVVEEIYNNVGHQF